MTASKTQVSVPKTRPLVFVGPSIPEDEVRDLLPMAEIRGPIQRGDLYTARLLRYSTFIVIDGVFAQTKAISPREVVDVVSDGAVFLGSSSMGALRAVDCAPAGTQGIGAVWRLFRRGILSSEDEVAVLFLPERPYPALTISLVNIRVALRHAVRARAIDAKGATALIDAAEQLHYSERTWKAVFQSAEIEFSPSLKTALSATDVKRADARVALKFAANRIAANPDWLQRPRQSRTTFNLLGQGRSHETDPLLGRDLHTTAPGFLLWMLASGRAPTSLTKKCGSLIRLKDKPDLNAQLDQLTWEDIGPDKSALVAAFEALTNQLEQSDTLQSEQLRFVAICQAARLHAPINSQQDKKVLAEVEKVMIKRHGAVDWATLLADNSPASATALNAVRGYWANAKAFRRGTKGRKNNSE
ncbi:MAG: TfuA-like protein [Paracoccaceae bacterium]